jgi:hypothetical protein
MVQILREIVVDSREELIKIREDRMISGNVIQEHLL